MSTHLPFPANSTFRRVRDGHPVALALYGRHYSARQYANRKLLVGPGHKMLLLSHDDKVLIVWRRFIDDSGQQGTNCAVFRNEGEQLSSELLLEAQAIVRQLWPAQRLYTYVDASKIKSSNPGYCFKKAGWRNCGTTKGGLVILEHVQKGGVAA